MTKPAEIITSSCRKTSLSRTKKVAGVPTFSDQSPAKFSKWEQFHGGALPDRFRGCPCTPRDRCSTTGSRTSLGQVSSCTKLKSSTSVKCVMSITTSILITLLTWTRTLSYCNQILGYKPTHKWFTCAPACKSTNGLQTSGGVGLASSDLAAHQNI